MKRKGILKITVLALFAFVSLVGTNVKADLAIGSTLENFTLTDTNGKSHSFNDLKGKNGAVVVFLSTQCPVVRGYNERISKLAAEYQSKGINVIGINSNSTESLAGVKTHAETNYKFTVLKDEGNVIADQFGASVTPEVFYFNEKNVLVYRGAIDNDKSGENVTTNYLRDAMDLTIAGKPVAKTTAFAIGCTIKRAGKN
jgi:peroxiredoxin